MLSENLEHRIPSSTQAVRDSYAVLNFGSMSPNGGDYMISITVNQAQACRRHTWL